MRRLMYVRTIVCCTRKIMEVRNHAKRAMSRWKDSGNQGKKKKKQLTKMLRYFPLKPRLQRLLMSSKIATNMQWHAENNGDGSLWHPKDSEAWKTSDAIFPTFDLDPHNMRLGLANDGFNPFGTLSTNYSID